MRVVGDPPDGLEAGPHFEDPEATPQLEMDCVDVRDRLTEYALSLLPAPEVEPVERHLLWCAGCRKEAAELAGGAAAAAMSIPQADPPRSLEERVVREIRQASGIAKERRGRARSRTMIILAATLALVMGIGWWSSSARHQPPKQAQAASERTAERVGVHLSKLIREFTGGQVQRKPGDLLREVQLTPELHTVGGGKAEIFLSSHRDDWVLVYVGGLDPKAGPYGATLQSADGTVLAIGQADAVNGGGVALFNQFPESLKTFGRIVVTDGRGHVVLTGTVTETGTGGVTATPSSAG